MLYRKTHEGEINNYYREKTIGDHGEENRVCQRQTGKKL